MGHTPAVLLISLLIININPLISQTTSSNQSQYYNWTESIGWSPCSVSCGEGIQSTSVYCVQTLPNKPPIKQPNYKCATVSNRPSISTKVCSISRKCPTTRFLWKVTQWSVCSQSCGNLGQRSREIDCVLQKSDSMTITVEREFCRNFTTPISISRCNVRDCPPNFVPGKWGKCIQGAGCSLGRQKRKLYCYRTKKTGISIDMLSMIPCYKLRVAPPPVWRTCFNYIRQPGCWKNSTEKQIKFNIDTNSTSNIYQMRQTRKVLMRLGQVGYLLPFSRVVISCPVLFFPKYKLIWQHKNESFKFEGRIKKRVKVDRSGRLKIKKLLFKDQGKWICKAGSHQKNVIIKLRNPSSGYRDWLVRSNFWKSGMLSEEHIGRSVMKLSYLSTNKKSVTPLAFPRTLLAITRNNVPRWVKSDWSPCSVTCSQNITSNGSQDNVDGRGWQYREVHCELLESHHTYTILDDRRCEKPLANGKYIARPDRMRPCGATSECPFWRTVKLSQGNASKCTDLCIDVGTAMIYGIENQCIYRKRIVSSQYCNAKLKPKSIHCTNQLCQLDWSVSVWSKCSKRCGGNGYQARSIRCVWKSSRKSAGSLCYKYKLPIPKVYRVCSTKPCNKGCIDLSTKCVVDKRNCYRLLYRYMCCQTCQIFSQ